jgi:hypothetical protein
MCAASNYIVSCIYQPAKLFLFPIYLHMTEQIPFFYLRGAWAETRLEELIYFFERILFFFRSFRKIAKCDYSFVMSVRPFVRARETTNFHDVGYLSIFASYVLKMEDSLKSYKNNGYFTQNIMTSVISRAGFTIKHHF